MKNTVVFIVALLAGFFNLLNAQHTFSIVAVDPLTGEVGSAGATCLSSSDCGGCGGAIIISGIVPGVGAINSQATVCIPNSNLNSAISYMNQGYTPQQIIANLMIFDACQFGDTSKRQYGIADLDSLMNPRTASFSGSGTMSYSNHITGPNYSIQGNILLGQQILDSIEAGFLNTQGRLCDRLMAALQGANVAGADTRCLSDGVSSKSAFLRVAKPGDDPQNLWLDIRIEQVAQGVEPIDTLQVLVDQFKGSLGLLDEEPKGKILVIPTPASEAVRLSLKNVSISSGKLNVYDVTGKLCISRKIDGNFDEQVIRLSELGAKGIYHVDVYDSEKEARFSGKILFQ